MHKRGIGAWLGAVGGACVLWAGPAASAWAAPETVVVHETDKYFYREGFVQKFEGQFEYTYLVDLEKNTMIRTRIYDYQSKKITPDETAYQLQSQLNSHPTQAARYSLTPVIRGMGQTGPDVMELVVIDDRAAHIVRSTSNEIVLAHAKRLR